MRYIYVDTDAESIWNINIVNYNSEVVLDTEHISTKNINIKYHDL